jgi:hypothetical protein
MIIGNKDLTKISTYARVKKVLKYWEAQWIGTFAKFMDSFQARFAPIVKPV